jgi:P27 family predicted phage terminase small subunit
VAQRLLCPAWLCPEGKKVWRVLVHHLSAMGIVGAVDQFALARYCVFHVRWLAAEQDLREHGARLPLCNAAGEVIGHCVNPMVKVAGDLADKLLRLEQHYGMTASSRASLSVAPGTRDTPAQATPDKSRFFTRRVDQ